MRIAAQQYTFALEDIEFIVSEFRTLLESGGFLTLGRHGEQFEQEFASYHGLPFAVATNSGTGALEILLRAVHVEGREVIVPANTFAATAFAVIHAGGRPVFADILPDLTLDPADAEARITQDTAAVITVHIGGLISPTTLQLAELCSSRGIPLIEDAAHAHGSTLDGKAAGSFGLAAAFSFFSTKVMTTGEGGMILTGSETLSREAQVLRDQAKVGQGNFHESVGYNWRMPEIQAIMGLAQVRRLDEFIKQRRRIAATYDDALEGLQGLHRLEVPARSRHNYYKYVVFLDRVSPGEIAARLKQQHQIALGGFVYELPLHEQPAFHRYYQEPLRVAEDLCRRHICLPIYPSLTDEEARYVAGTLCEEMLVGAGTRE